MSQNFEIHVISLKNQTHRRKKIEAILEGQCLKWSFFDAIAGEDISNYLGMYNREKRLRNLGYDLRINEIACFISHRTLWEECARKGIPFLILEDDIKIKYYVGDFAQAAQIVHLIIEKIKAEYLFVRLGNLFDRKFQILQKISDDFNIVRYQRDPSTAMGYIISPKLRRFWQRRAKSFFVLWITICGVAGIMVAVCWTCHLLCFLLQMLIRHPALGIVLSQPSDF